MNHNLKYATQELPGEFFRPVQDAHEFWAQWAPSRMAAHLLLSVDEEGAVNVEARHPFTDLDQVKADAGIGPRYDGDLNFLPRCETRPLLDELMKGIVRKDGGPAWYVVGSFVGGLLRSHREAMAAELRLRLAAGLMSAKLHRRFTVIYMDVRGAEGSFLAIDSEVTGASLKLLKLKLGISRVVAKRASRFMSPYPLVLGFTIDRSRTQVRPDGVVLSMVSDLTGTMQTVFLPDQSKLTAEQRAMMDGINTIKGIFDLTGNRAYKHCYVTPVIGDAGVGKGASQYAEWVQFDYVINELKTELVMLGDRAYMGVLAEIHLHPGRLDFQTIGNLGFYEPELVVAQGREYFMEIYRAAVDTTDFLAREMAAARLRVETGKASDVLTTTGESRTSMWAGKRSMLLGVGKDRFPVLFRRWLQPLLENSDDITKGRVPVPIVFKRINLTPNVACFDERGIPQPSLDRLTRERFPDVPETFMGVKVYIVCAPDMAEGPMMLVRNPNTHSGEAVLVWNKHLPELMREKGCGLVYFGFEALVLMVCLNGADFDDQVLATTELAWILKWLSVRRVAGKKLESVAGAKPTHAVVQGVNELDEADIARTKALIGTEWSQEVFLDRLAHWVEDELSLGRFINLCMLFNLFTGENGQAMRASLLTQIQEAEARILALGSDEVATKERETLKAKIVVCKKGVRFLDQLDPHLLDECMDNSDLVIDYIQGGKGDPLVVQRLYNLAKSLLVWNANVDLAGVPVLEEIPVFPTCWTIGKNRIPRARYKEDATPFVLADSKMCLALKSITEMRDKLIDFGRRREYRLWQPLPASIEKLYPSTSYSRTAASLLADAWRAELDFYIAENERHGGTGLPKEGYKWAAVGRKRRIKVNGEWVNDVRPGLIEKFFYLPDAEGNLKFLRKEYRFQMVAEYYRRVYRRERELKYDNQGHVMHYPDGMPDYVVNDLLTMLDEAKLTGLVVVVALNHYAKTHLTESVVVVKKADGGVYRLDGDRLLGETTELAEGTYTMSPNGVIVVAEAKPEIRSDYKVEQIKAAVEGKEDPKAIATDTFAF